MDVIVGRGPAKLGVELLFEASHYLMITRVAAW